MHIEPGLLSHAKLLLAGAGATTVLVAHALPLLKSPLLWLRTLLAALFFALFMQAFHMKAGPSELHFLGAMPLYLAFGYLPTLFGLVLGLLVQGLLFEPQDLAHLAVNSLSLVLPLMLVHHGVARRVLAQTAGRVGIKTVLQLDSVYYAGVIAMVAFWLSLSDAAGALAGFTQFALSYLPMLALEPLVTVLVLALIARLRRQRWAGLCFAPAHA